MNGPEPGRPDVALEAPAKVNPFLRVLRRRDDGHHDVETVILPVSLADEVVVRPAERLRVEVRGSPDAVYGVPVDEGNLALRAAVALAQECPAAAPAEIEVHKRIPVAAGLGGGSADAAAALLALDRLWGCGLGPAALARVGARIGSDVPALVAGGPVLVRGRGEEVEPIETGQFRWVLWPLGFPVRSGDAYRWWDEDRAGTGPDPAEVLAALSSGDPERLAPLLADDLQGPVARRHPQVAEAVARFLDAGALAAVMSGSGPTVVALVRDREQADGIVSWLGETTLAVESAASTAR
ncbi:MAG: 4-(cytidine 5'-diphospho)-2-C-methyl-D-erythritol kinase [Actinobacteria bacterium]|nr:4-(cytidine 5'-diphospho)-2-C-methyl-D-erythritol kinase [Actinomycetota bacterium]